MGKLHQSLGKLGTDSVVYRAGTLAKQCVGKQTSTDWQALQVAID